MASVKTKGTKKSSVSKTSKRKGSSKPPLVVPDAWINELANQEINEDDWTCSVVMIEELCPAASVFLELFNSAAAKGNRLAIKSITHTNIKEFVIKTIMKEQNNEVTPLDLLCKEIFKEVGQDFDKVIPTCLLAHILKYMILEHKALNKHIRNNITNKYKELEDYHQSLWPVTNTKSVSAKSAKTGVKSSISGKNGSSKSKTKTFTKLRRRGEEWMDKLWIDDAPVNGPQLYVAISTFYDSSLPFELLKINVPLEAIVEIDKCSADGETNSFTSILCSSLLNLRKISPGRIRTLQEMKKSKITKFWDEIDFLKNNQPTSLMLRNIMFLRMTPNLSHSSLDKQIFLEDMYKQVSHFMYDIFENYELFKAYISELDIKDVTDDSICVPSNMTIYNSILDNIPAESLTIACLLDALLEQVCCPEDIEVIKKSTLVEEPQIDCSVNDSVKEHLQRLNVKYDIFQDVSSPSSSYTAIADEPLTNSDPIKTILIYSDDASIKTFHLKQAVASYIKTKTKEVLGSAWKDFWTKFYILNVNDYKFIRLCNVIIQSENKKDQDNLYYYYIYIIILNCILNSLFMSKDFDTKDHLNCNVSFSHSKDYRKSDLCEDCLQEINSATDGLESSKSVLSSSDLLETSKDSKNTSSYSLTAEVIADNQFYTENMPSDILLQNLQRDFQSFRKFETRYSPFTDQLMIVFHDLFSVEGPSEEFWVGKLSTKVPAKDFVEYILAEEYSWFESYINNIPTQLLASDSISCAPSCVLGMPSFYILADSVFLSHRSLKYERAKRVQEKQKSPSSSKLNISRSRSATIRTGAKHSLDTDEMGGQEEVINKESFFKPTKSNRLTAYHLGDPKRIQFTGLVKDKLFEDTTKITIKKVHELYGEESRSLNVTINGHTFYYNYNPFFISNEQCHLVLSSGIILYFKRPIIDVSQINDSPRSTNKEKLIDTIPEIKEIEPVNSQNLENLDIKTSSEFLSYSGRLSQYEYFNKFPHELKLSDFHKIPLVYDFEMSTPSGLHVDLVKVEQKDLMYVRQELLSKCYTSELVQHEKLRCYSSCGYIIKFLINDKIEIIGGNGATYIVYKTRENEAVNEDDKLSVKDEGSDVKDKSSLIGKLAKSQRTSKRKNSSKKQSKKNPSVDSESLFKKLEQELKADFHSNITNYKHISSDGKQYIVKDSICKRIEDILMMSSFDISHNCVTSERFDGLTSTHHADGSLTVTYPDGSTITSLPFEAEEIFCQWNAYEFDLWFSTSETDSSSATTTCSNQLSQSTKTQDGTIEQIFPPSLKNELSDSKDGFMTVENTNGMITSKTSVGISLSLGGSHSMSSTFGNVTANNEAAKNDNAKIRKSSKILYSEDGFVVYTLNYLMEHPNYSSVYYDCDRREVEFKLPFSTSVKLSSDGTYRACFEGVKVMIGKDEVYLNKLSENGQLTRTVFVNTNRQTNKSCQDFQREGNIAACFYQPDVILLSPEIQRRLFGFHSIHSYLLYSVNETGEEFSVDFDLNISELESKVRQKLQGSEYCCYVINKDFSGFKLLDSIEVGQHLQLVREHGGLVRQSENSSNVLTSQPVFQNESQKWYMRRQNSSKTTFMKSNVSTFGRRESWTKPFVIHDKIEQDSEVFICRILQKIPNYKNVLSEFKLALEEFKRCSKSCVPLTVAVGSEEGLQMSEIVRDPSILSQIYKDEKLKVEKENDQFRNRMKNSFLRSLIHQACIKARKARQKNKVEEFKYILRNKTIPPYHLSCFGQVHFILEEVLDNVSNMRKTPSSHARIASIIDEILNLALTVGTQDAFRSKEEDDQVVQEVINEIFENFCDISKKQSHQRIIMSILEKPLYSVTMEEIKLLCQVFESGEGDCPILYEEGFILQDVLEARYQLSHYFENLKDMLEYYRHQVITEDSLNL